MKDSGSAVRDSEKSVGWELMMARAKGADLPKSLKASVLQLSVAVVDPSRPGEHFSVRPSRFLHVS